MLYSKNMSEVFGEGNIIKGLIPYGETTGKLSHVMVSDKGKVVHHKYKRDKTTDLFQILGERDGFQLNCAAQNSHKPNHIAFGSKDQLL